MQRTISAGTATICVIAYFSLAIKPATYSPGSLYSGGGGFGVWFCVAIYFKIKSAPLTCSSWVGRVLVALSTVKQSQWGWVFNQLLPFLLTN